MKRGTIEKLEVLAVGPVDFAVGDGRCTGIQGTSGSGKALFLRAGADMTEHSGRVFSDGTESLQMSTTAWRVRVGMLPARNDTSGLAVY